MEGLAPGGRGTESRFSGNMTVFLTPGIMRPCCVRPVTSGVLLRTRDDSQQGPLRLLGVPADPLLALLPETLPCSRSPGSPLPRSSMSFPTCSRCWAGSPPPRTHGSQGDPAPPTMAGGPGDHERLRLDSGEGIPEALPPPARVSCLSGEKSKIHAFSPGGHVSAERERAGGLGLRM